MTCIRYDRILPRLVFFFKRRLFLPFNGYVGIFHTHVLTKTSVWVRFNNTLLRRHKISFPTRKNNHRATFRARINNKLRRRIFSSIFILAISPALDESVEKTEKLIRFTSVLISIHRYCKEFTTK